MNVLTKLPNRLLSFKGGCLLANCVLVLVAAVAGSCRQQPETAEYAYAVTESGNAAKLEVPVVEVSPVKRQSFDVQVISNGKLLMSKEAKLVFGAGGMIEEIKVSNGSRVRAGQLLASLRNREQQLALLKAELRLAESRVEVNDLLVTQGGRRGDSTSVAPEIYGYIKLRSGYQRALLDLQKAHLDLENTFLRAPFAGVVANLTIAAHNQAPADKAFCSLFSPSEVLVRCPVLETELAAVTVGQAAEVAPVGLPGKTYSARVVAVNFEVNMQGLVDVTLRIERADKHLLPGMNVGVVITKALPGQTVIPKNAIVDRSGQKVVFTYEKGFAKWHYVKVSHENATQVSLLEGVEVGKNVITSGNVNLGHNAQVIVAGSE